MWIKNNSKKEWLGYNCGNGIVVDVFAEATFEVPDDAGRLLLKLLGCPAWLEETSAPVVAPDIAAAAQSVVDTPKPKVEDVPRETPDPRKAVMAELDELGVQYNKRLGEVKLKALLEETKAAQVNNEDGVDLAGEQEEPQNE